MMAAKHLCPTCGYKIPKQPKQAKILQDEPAQASNGFWSKLVKWDFASHSADKVDQAQDKPIVIS